MCTRGSRHLSLRVGGHDRDDVRAQRRGELACGRADAASRAVHEHRLALAQVPAPGESEVDGQIVHRERGRSFERDPVRKREHHPRLGRHHLGKAAEPGEGGHALAGVEAGAGGSRADDSGDLGTGHERQRRLHLVFAPALQHLRERDSGGVHVDDDVAVPDRLRDINNLDRARTVQSADLDRADNARLPARRGYAHWSTNPSWRRLTLIRTRRAAALLPIRTFVALMLLLTLAACGDDDDDATATTAIPDDH